MTQNAVGNKIDYFLRRELQYRVQLDRAKGRLSASVKVSLHNDAAADGGGAPTMVRNDLSPRLPRPMKCGRSDTSARIRYPSAPDRLTSQVATAEVGRLQPRLAPEPTIRSS